LKIETYIPVEKSLLDTHRFKHIIWDWNGTLLDDVSASLNALNRLLAEHNLPPATREDYLAHFGFPVRDYYTHIGFPADLAPDAWQTLAQNYHDYFNADPSQKLFPDARASLQRCADAQLPQSILSALHQPLLNEAMDTHNLASFFTRVHGVGDLHGSSKLQQGRALLRDLALPSQNILLIGDTLHDAHVAAELGLRCVLVTRGHQHASRLLAAGVPCFPDLATAMDWIFCGAPAPC